MGVFRLTCYRPTISLRFAVGHTCPWRVRTGGWTMTPPPDAVPRRHAGAAYPCAKRDVSGRPWYCLVTPEIGHDLGLHMHSGVARIHFFRTCREKFGKIKTKAAGGDQGPGPSETDSRRGQGNFGNVPRLSLMVCQSRRLVPHGSCLEMGIRLHATISTGMRARCTLYIPSSARGRRRKKREKARCDGMGGAAPS